ncbi:uncharacterized mitochondrial protein-like protein [Tanacetum coccineum]
MKMNRSRGAKLQQEQDMIGHEADVRLPRRMDEEERQRMAKVHEASLSFTEEEWESIRARVEADEELSKRLQAEERNKYSEVDQAKMLSLAWIVTNCLEFNSQHRLSPDRVYKVEKALYGLHQAPKAWYETLSTYLLDNGFQRGKIDKTLFIKRHKGDILLVQVYVDDIIFGSTKKELCNAFEKLMHEKFQMSSMGELTFFLGLQVQQKKDGIFISQDKYVVEILKKFGFTEVKTASTPMETQKPLLKDEDGEEVDVHMYRSMIGSLMYLTSSRPDIMFAVCACARYQVNPKVSHLHAVKRIFRYLKGQPKLGLWYLKDSPFDLVAYTDSDYAGASLDRKSTNKRLQFLEIDLISCSARRLELVANSTTEAEYVAASSCCGQVLWIQNQLLDYGYNFMHTKIFIDNNIMVYCLGQKILMGEVLVNALVDGKMIIVTKSTVIRVSTIEVAEDEAVHKELGGRSGEGLPYYLLALEEEAGQLSRMSNTSDKGTTFGGWCDLGLVFRDEIDVDLIAGGRSSFARCLIKVNSEANLVDVVTIVASPLIVATSNVVTPNAEKTNDGFQTVGKMKKRKGKSKSTNGGQFTGPSVKHNVRYEPKATTSAPKKGTTYVGYTSQSTPMLKTTGNSSKKDNLSMSNSFSALNEEEEEDEEDVENVYDESANLIQNTKAGGSSSFTTAAG